MNIALRKLAMLEANMIKQEEQARMEGFTTCPIDTDLKRRISELMDRVRVL